MVLLEGTNIAPSVVSQNKTQAYAIDYYVPVPGLRAMTNPTPTVLMRSLSLQSGLIAEEVESVEYSSLLEETVVESLVRGVAVVALVGSLAPNGEEWEFQSVDAVVVVLPVVLVVVGSVQAAAAASAAGPKNKDEAALECR